MRYALFDSVRFKSSNSQKARAPSCVASSTTLAQSPRRGPLASAGAQAPAVAGLEAWEAPLEIGGREVIACGLRVRQELGGQDDANGVRADVFRACVAAAVAEKAGHWRRAAGGKIAAEDVFGFRQAGYAVRGCDADHGCYL